MGDGKRLVRELHIYSEKIDEPAFKNLFEQLTKTRIPIFGFLDFSFLFSIAPTSVIVNRKNNTIRFYLKESGDVGHLSHLLFPFRLSDPLNIEKIKGSYFPFPKMYFFSNENVLNLILKEDIEEISFKVLRILGKYFAIAKFTDRRGKNGLLFLTNPSKFLEVDLEKHPSMYFEVLEPIPKSISIDAKNPIFEDANTTVGIDSYDSMQHSLVVGESGSGKSVFLYIMIKALQKKFGDKIRIIIIDPHGEFIKFFPNEKVIDFKSAYVEPLDVGNEKSPLMTQLVAQLISSVIGEDNKYAERVLFYSVYLLSSIDALDLKSMSDLLTDPSKRMEFTTKCNVDEVKRFFDQEYQDIYMHHFNDAVLPILNFIGEYELYLGKEMKRERMIELMEKHNIVVISFNPNFFGKRMIKFLAGAIINQMYNLAITNKVERPTMMFIDEFPRVETIAIKDILAETRKFNLYLCLSLQYLGQLRKEVLDGIISNVRNIVSFKLNRQDASLVSSIMEIKVEEFFKKHRSTTELEESKKEMFVRLHQRECIVRLFDGNKYILPMKLKCVDKSKWDNENDVQLQREKQQYGPQILEEKKTEEQKLEGESEVEIIEESKDNDGEKFSSYKDEMEIEKEERHTGNRAKNKQTKQGKKAPKKKK